MRLNLEGLSQPFSHEKYIRTRHLDPQKGQFSSKLGPHIIITQIVYEFSVFQYITYVRIWGDQGNIHLGNAKLVNYLSNCYVPNGADLA